MLRHGGPHQQKDRSSIRPIAATQEVFAFGNSPGCGHHQCEAEVGRRFGQNIRRVADQHPVRGAGGHVGVVVPRRHAAHRAQFRARREQGNVDRLRTGDEHAAHALQPANQPGRRPDIVGIVGLDVEMLAQSCDCIAEDSRATRILGRVCINSLPD